MDEIFFDYLENIFDDNALTGKYKETTVDDYELEDAEDTDND